jgi:hypothetical protein
MCSHQLLLSPVQTPPIALASGKIGSGEKQASLIGQMRIQTLPGCPAHVMAVEVVDLVEGNIPPVVHPLMHPLIILNGIGDTGTSHHHSKEVLNPPDPAVLEKVCTVPLANLLLRG